jgi:hypothetical protein
VWAVTLVATMVAHPVSLTITRVVTPASVVALVAVASDGHASSVALGEQQHGGGWQSNRHRPGQR